MLDKYMRACRPQLVNITDLVIEKAASVNFHCQYGKGALFAARLCCFMTLKRYKTDEMTTPKCGSVLIDLRHSAIALPRQVLPVQRAESDTKK